MMNFTTEVRDRVEGAFSTEIKIDTSITMETKIHALLDQKIDYAWYPNGVNVLAYAKD